MNPTWQQGDYIIKGPDKRKILGVCGEIVFPSMMNVFDIASVPPCTQHEFEVEGYSLVPPVEEWPKHGDMYWFVTSEALIYERRWSDDSIFLQNRKAFGNCHRDEASALRWRDRVKALKEL